MSGPMPPALSAMFGIQPARAGTIKAQDRPPGVLPPGQSREPIVRSPLSQRIITARKLGVDPSEIKQAPGYRPPLPGAPMPTGKGDRGGPPAPQQAAPQSEAMPERAPMMPRPRPIEADTIPPMAGPIPMPRPRPGVGIEQYLTPVGTERERREQAQAEAVRLAAEGKPIKYSTNGWPSAPPPTTATSPVWGKGAMPVPGVGGSYAKPAPQPQVREATPEEISAAQKNDIAKKVATERIKSSGGEGSAAPTPQAAVTPPAASPAKTPAQAPPPAYQESFRPTEGRPVVPPEYVVKQVEEERRTGGRTKKEQEQKSTVKGAGKSETYGASPAYYHKLGVPEGDNNAANAALNKLGARIQKKDPTVTAEELQLYWGSRKQQYNKPVTAQAIEEYYKSTTGSGKKERNMGQADVNVEHDPKNPETVLTNLPQENPRPSTVNVRGANTYATRVPPAVVKSAKGAPVSAEKIVEVAIDEAGRPVWQGKRYPLQEDYNSGAVEPPVQPNTKYKADVDADPGVEETEGEN